MRATAVLVGIATVGALAGCASVSPSGDAAPNGVVQDSQRYWSAGKAMFDPADIRVPTLLIKAKWDQHFLDERAAD